MSLGKGILIGIGAFLVGLLVLHVAADWENAGLRVDAEKTVTRTLLDPQSAQFDRVRVVQSGDRKFVCGWINAKNRFGGYVGRQPFVYEPLIGRHFMLDEASDRSLRARYFPMCGISFWARGQHAPLLRNLAEHPGDMVRLACTKCERRGQATLIERYGPDKNMVDLRLELAASWPKVAAGKPGT
jgi:hypothetical protein